MKRREAMSSDCGGSRSPTKRRLEAPSTAGGRGRGRGRGRV